ncbi:heavy metal translocating P-type ATPase [Clostridium phoceensis]|uniref:heavy metal translocating P-type ATPase n=1 Tax=Clostridium phoceensis TaxID=1650661 RepID=UPI00067ECE93|nr:heavy metal translocating P-type ATPase [Clostridium phoceensis]
MENLTNTAVHLLEDSQGADLTRREKRKLSVEITTAMIALVCLVTGLLYKGIFPEQTAVAGLIYSVGVLVEGLPLLATAIRGFLQRDVTNAMEILVSIAVLACYITGQHELAILIPVVLSVVHFLEERSIMGGRDAIEGLKQMQATDAVLETEDGEVTVEVQALKRGDIIIVRPGMGLPIDGTVIWGNSNIDQKSLTGEPLPAAVTVGDTVYAGTTNLDGMIKIRVEKEYQDTSFTKIVSLLEEAQSITVPEIRIVDRFMHYYIPLALIVAALTALLSRNISNAIAVLVVSCPCGHMLVSSAPMIAALAVSTKRGILIKNAKFVEQLTNITTVIFDKTGTITRGELSISGFYLQEAQSREELFARGGCVACSSMHPISRSLMKTLEGEGIPYEEGFQVRETAGKGLTGTRGGEEILFGSRHWIESLGYQPEDPHMDTGGGPANWVVYNGRVLGCLMFDDSVRPEAEEVVSRLHEDGMEQTVLLTGDREFAARKVQRQTGIDQVYFHLLPEEKLEHVKRLRQDAHVLAVGDGINDALALAEADVGIAMGAMGSDVAIQSADIALMNNDLNNIPFVMSLARSTKSIMYQNIGIAFSVSLIMMILAAVGVIPALAGAFLHNIGAFVILINSSRILRDSGGEG